MTDSTLRTYVADERDWDEIHRLNHEVYAEELGQHGRQPDARLVDSRHHDNVYIVARRAGVLVGMIALARPERGPFSTERRMSDPGVIAELRSQTVEARLLAVPQRCRGQHIYPLLVLEAFRFIVDNGYRYALISALADRVPLYRRLGFEAVGEPVVDHGLLFTPMLISAHAFLTQPVLLPGAEELLECGL